MRVFMAISRCMSLPKMQVIVTVRLISGLRFAGDFVVAVLGIGELWLSCCSLRFQRKRASARGSIISFWCWTLNGLSTIAMPNFRFFLIGAVQSPLTISIARSIWLSCPAARASGEISIGTSGSTPFPSRLLPCEVYQPKTGKRSQ